ncbi:MAG: hypothetical protein KKF44_03175 [Nanoarchaeota archaeon]|nr:hypothetical protein [Nanoarchaeota archaeon]
MNRNRLEWLLRHWDKGLKNPATSYVNVLESFENISQTSLENLKYVAEAKDYGKLDQLDRLLFMVFSHEVPPYNLIDLYLKRIKERTLEEITQDTEHLISLIELKYENPKIQTGLETVCLFNNPASALDGRVVEYTEKRLADRKRLVSGNLRQGKHGYRINLKKGQPRVRLGPVSEDFSGCLAENISSGEGIYAAEERTNVLDFSHVNAYSGYSCYLYDLATGVHPDSENSTYFLRQHDMEIMRHLRHEIDMSGYENEFQIRKGKKHNIYAALFSGPGNHELGEIKELFPDYIPVFVDINFDNWEQQVKHNVKEILGPDVKFGSLKGSKANLLVKNEKLRYQVIKAAKKCGALPNNVEHKDVHIVWRSDQTPFNFGFKQQVQFFKNIKAALRESDYYDTAHIGVARTPQVNQASHLMNMGIANDTDYSDLENEAYMMYISSIILGLPIRSTKYYADFVLEEKYPEGMVDIRLEKEKLGLKQKKTSKIYQNYLYDIGVYAKKGLVLGENTVPTNTQISFVTSRRPDKTALSRLFKKIGMSGYYLTSSGHLYSPQSIITMGREAEITRIVYSIKRVTGNQNPKAITYFESKTYPIDPSFPIGMLLNNAFDRRPEKGFKNLFFKDGERIYNHNLVLDYGRQIKQT